MEDFQIPEEEKEKFEKGILKFVFISVLVLGGLGLLNTNRNLFFILLSILVVIIFVALGIKSTKRKQKILFYAFALFFFSHLLVFPLIYSSLLKKNPHSIVINEEILSNEKGYALSEINKEYSPQDKSSKIKLIEQVLSILKTTIDTSLNYLNNNILILDSFLIARKDTSIITGHEPGQGHEESVVLLFNKYGHLISSFYEKSLYKTYYKKSKIFEYLSRYKEYYEENISSYSEEKKDILTKNKIWSYTRILPYSINIFTTDHFKPISRSANIIYNIHYWLVWGLILSIIFSIILDLIVTKLK